MACSDYDDDHAWCDTDLQLRLYTATDGPVIRNKSKNGRKQDDGDSLSTTKKLKLSIDQTMLLEESFKQHSTLTMVQKKALAEKLNLKQRQVEVWFQNRRARTKLKQTEMECKALRKNCERLIEENRRLSRELLELRSAVRLDVAAPPYVYNFHKMSGKLTNSTSRDTSININFDSGAGGGPVEVVHSAKMITHRR